MPRAEAWRGLRAARRSARQVALEGLSVLLLFAVVTAVGLAFAWPWLPRFAYGGQALARYAPLNNGDSFLLAKYDPTGRPTSWESQNVAVVPGLRALTQDLR